MTPEQIAADVDRLIVIRAEIAALAAEAKQIEARLELAGLKGEQIPLQDEEREGRQFIARGTKMAVPIRFESDQLISTFKVDSEHHKTLTALLGDKFPLFFKEVRVFERKHKDDANKFRKFARAELVPELFAKLIAACISKDKKGIAKSKTVIALDDAIPVEQAQA